jgi:hypothetical protein
MAVTHTQTHSHIRNIVVGAYISTSTAAAFDIECGFTPRYVRIVNETSGDVIEWFEGMADAEGYKRVAAGTGALVTSNGITPLANGFTVGLDTDINVISEQLSYIAIG